MSNPPKNKYALGIFCQTVRPYMKEYSRTISGFMKDYFDAVLDTEELEKGESPNESAPEPSRTSIAAGPWKGINSTDLSKFYWGQRRLPDWKAQSFIQHLDKSRIEELCDGIGVDGLMVFQEALANHGIVVKDIIEIPTAVYEWLKLILDANANRRDIEADGVENPIQVDLFQGVSLPEGRITGGKLELGRSSLPWKPSPEVPADPDPELESVYTRQMLAAFGDHLNESVTNAEHLPHEFQKVFTRERGYFYSAEGVRRNLRDVVVEGDREFSAMKTDLYDGVCGVCEGDYADGWARMRTTLSYAANFNLNGSVITKFPAMVKAAHKRGMCHMLANDQLLEWVRLDD